MIMTLNGCLRKVVEGRLFVVRLTKLRWHCVFEEFPPLLISSDPIMTVHWV